jgi:hypothetical protein
MKWYLLVIAFFITYLVAIWYLLPLVVNVGIAIGEKL